MPFLQLSVTDPMLAWLYRHAEAVLVPSLGRGLLPTPD